MLKRRRVIAAALLGASTVLASFALVRAHTGSTPSQSLRQQGQPSAVTVADDAPPPWPEGTWGNRDAWAPMTMTDFHVTHIVRGTMGAWWQDTELGASPDLIRTCKDFARNAPNETMARLNQQYVLFLKHNPKTAKLELWYGSLAIFPVIGGRVYTAAAVRPELAGGTGVVMDFKPEPLAAFLASVQTPR